MSSYTYYPGIPNPPNDPSGDVPLMKTNAQSINDMIAVDHIGFNTSNGGYHNVIHLVNQGSDPGAFVGGVQLYSKASLGTDLLFAKLPSGSINQLNGFTGSNPGHGFAGGMIFAYGLASAAGTVTFESGGFPNAIFSVVVTPVIVGATTSKITAYTSAVTNTSFFINVNGTGSTSGYNFYWMAIGW